MSNRSIEEDEPMPPRPLEARSLFPVTQLLILALGALLFLLVLSAGFNFWLFFNPDVHFDRVDDARRAEDIARQQQVQARDALERAAVMQQEFQRKQGVLQREIEDLTRQLEGAKEQLEEAKRAKLEK